VRLPSLTMMNLTTTHLLSRRQQLEKMPAKCQRRIRRLSMARRSLARTYL
jgi:hypothetical protein